MQASIMMTEISKCRLMDSDIEEQVRGCVGDTEGTMRKDSLWSDSGSWVSRASFCAAGGYSV